MKKILFATSALVASAGIAHADVTLSGSAGAGVASEAGADAFVYSFAEVVVTMEGEADNGLTFGASIDATAGRKYDIGDFEDDGDKDGTFGLGSIYVAYGGAKLSFDNDGIDDLYDDDYDTHDIAFSYANAGFTVDLTVDAEATVSEYSYKLSYTSNGFTGTLVGNDLDDNMAVTVAYAMDAFSVSLEHDLNGAGDAINTLTLGYEANGFSVEVSADDNDDWDLDLGYTMNALTLAAETNEEEEWELSMEYDFGGGLSAVSGVKYDDSYYAGLTMSF